MINKAQSTLEFTVVFVIMAALLMGMLSLWKWSSDRIVKRQLKYESERLEKGTRSSDWFKEDQTKIEVRPFGARQH